LLQGGALQLPFRFLRLDQKAKSWPWVRYCFRDGNSAAPCAYGQTLHRCLFTARSTTSTCLKCCSPSARDSCDRSNSNRQARCSRQRAIAGRIRRQVPAGTARQRPNAIRCPDRSLPPPDQIPRVFVGHSFDKMSPPARKDRSDREPCKRLYFIPHKSVLSAQATGLKQILLCIANSLR